MIKLFGHHKLDVNSRKFYEKHPDLAPRNVYLYYGRTLDMFEVNKTIKRITTEPLHKRVIRYISNVIKNIFKKEK